MIIKNHSLVKKFKWIRKAFFASISLIILCVFYTIAYGESNSKDQQSLIDLKKELLSYFIPLTGQITSINDTTLIVEIDKQIKINPGARLNAFKEGVSFIHPVTKEEIGKIEIPVGKIEITDIKDDNYIGKIIKGKSEDFLNAKVKIPATKIRILFVQGNVDWFLGDSYYQMLKETNRFELVDTAVDPENISDLTSEAKNKAVEAILILQSENINSNVKLTQRLLWTEDLKEFSKKDVFIDIKFIAELRSRSRLFTSIEEEAILSYKIPFGAKNISIGDVDGDDIEEIIIPSGSSVRIYRLGVDLTLFTEFKIPVSEILWFDSVSSIKDKRDKIIITGIRDNSVVSYIYELKGSNILEVWKKEGIFLRKFENNLIAQDYSKQNGYEGSVYYLIESDDTYKKGDLVKLPEGINIYDFQFIYSPDKKKAILVSDDNGYFHLYDEKGIRLWISNEDFGGHLIRFKKESLSPLVERGYWHVKDKVTTYNNEIFVIKRKPLLGVAKGLGYKSSEIKGFLWNGFSVEERTVIKEISGEILDLAISKKNLYVIARPILGFDFKNILKGDNPLVTMLYIYSLKGR
jgi:hypothetical protein